MKKISVFLVSAVLAAGLFSFTAFTAFAADKPAQNAVPQISASSFEQLHHGANRGSGHHSGRRSAGNDRRTLRHALCTDKEQCSLCDCEVVHACADISECDGSGNRGCHRT